MNSDLYKASPGLRAVWRWSMLAPLGLFVAYVALRGISESFDNEGFPEALAVKLDLLPIIFPIHMVTGGLSLLLVPLVLLLRGTRWHRLLGRVTAADILIAGLTAIPVALIMPVTTTSAAGFVAQGIAWIVLLGFGIWHIRARRIAAHRACMLMLAAVTLERCSFGSISACGRRSACPNISRPFMLSMPGWLGACQPSGWQSGCTSVTDMGPPQGLGSPRSIVAATR